MKKKIQESINFLFKEYKRLKIKDQKKIISKEERDVLNKIGSFIGKEKK